MVSFFSSDYKIIKQVVPEMLNCSFKVTPTCCSTIRSNVDFIACSWLCDRQLVVLSVGRFPAVPHVHSQLIMSRICDFMEVGETCNNLICVSWDGVREAKRVRLGDERSLTQPELIIHVTEASGVVLPVPVEFQLSILAPEQNLKRTDFHECHNSFAIIITSTAEVTAALSIIRKPGAALLGRIRSDLM